MRGDGGARWLSTVAEAAWDGSGGDGRLSTSQDSGEEDDWQ